MADKIYWDTNIFLDWLKGTYQDPSYKDGIEEIVKKVEKHELILTTSIVTKIEVLGCTLSIPQWDTFELFFKSRKATYIYLDNRVAQRAHSIRNYYQKNPPKLGTPDVIHLATAINAKVSIFYTNDGNHLLGLNGDVAGYKLKIEIPKSDKPNLPFSTT